MNKHYKILLAVAFTLVIVFAVGLYNNSKSLVKIQQLSIKYEAKTLADMLMSFRQTYQDAFIHNHINLNKSTINLLPVKTTNNIADLFSSHNVITKFATVSDNPRNPVNMANKRQLEFINKFKTNKNLEYIFQYDAKKKLYYYAQPLYITQRCLKCHGAKKDAPDIIQKNYTKAYNYKLGDLRGIIDVELTQTKMKNVLISYNNRMIISAIVLLSSLLLLLYIYTVLVVKQDKEIQQMHEDETKHILDFQTNFVLLTDAKRLLKANKTMLNFFGYDSLEEFTKDHNCLCELFLEGDGYLQQKQDGYTWIETLLNNPDVSHRVKLKDLNNNIKIFQAEVGYLKIQNEYIISLTDITKSLEQEKLLVEMSEELKAKEAVLAQQSKMAAMGEMLDSIAHQWKQPISVIYMYIQKLEMDVESNTITTEKLTEVIDISKEQIEHLTNTINEFRTFFRPNTNIEQISLESLIKSSLVLVHDDLYKNSIKTEIKGDKFASIKVNANEFKHVIINIVNNAKDAFIENKIDTLNRKIIFNIQQKDNKVIFSIEDNAGGIPKNIINKIFQPHFTTKEDGKGTGIGLYMTKQIIDKMGASIEVENIINGACFKIFI